MTRMRRLIGVLAPFARLIIGTNPKDLSAGRAPDEPAVSNVLQGSQVALVVSSEGYHRTPLPSLVTGIIRTIMRDMIVRKIGTLPAEELVNLESQLRVARALIGA